MRAPLYKIQTDFDILVQQSPLIATVDSRSNVFQGSDLNLPLEPKNAVAIPRLSRKNKAGKANDADMNLRPMISLCSADRILALI